MERGDHRPVARSRTTQEFSNEVLKQIAERNRTELNELPNDPAGQIKTLESTSF